MTHLISFPKRGLFLLSFFLLITSGCSRDFLSVRTEYISQKNLASYHVGTPDLRLLYPNVGQRLIVNWHIPAEYLKKNARLTVHIRLRNRQELVREVPLQKRKGSYVYSLLNEEYFETEGLLTYKVELSLNGELIKEWRQQLWTELILINPSD